MYLEQNFRLASILLKEKKIVWTKLKFSPKNIVSELARKFRQPRPTLDIRSQGQIEYYLRIRKDAIFISAYSLH